MTAEDAKEHLFRSGDPDYMTSLARGLEVMHAFNGATSGLTMSEISVTTGLSRAVVRRCLYTLQELGYVRSNRDVYQLEPKVLSLSHDFVSSSSLYTIAQPYLEEVSEQTKESCSLATLDGNDVVYVARAATRRIMTVSLTVGSRLPSFCTSLGRVLLAYLDADARNDILESIKIVSHTEHTVKTKRQLKQVLAGVENDGYSIVSEELEIGLRSIAVPVFGRAGTVVAGMNVGAQAARVSEAQLLEHLPVLKRAAERLGVQVT
ncbi:MAG: IclR family transcriptional regulator C-terminal domain-containing protein [Planctomycetota bacterium]